MTTRPPTPPDAELDAFLEACLRASPAGAALADETPSFDGLAALSLDGLAALEAARASAPEVDAGEDELPDDAFPDDTLPESAAWMGMLLADDALREIEGLAYAAEADVRSGAPALTPRLEALLIDAGRDACAATVATSATAVQTNGAVAGSERPHTPSETESARPELRVLRGRAPAATGSFGSGLLGKAVAAVLLIGFSVAIIAMSGMLRDEVDGGGAQAEAGFYVESVAHYVLPAESGAQPAAVETRRAAHLAVGEVLAAKPGGMVAYGLGSRSHVLLGAGDRLRVASGEQVPTGLLDAAAQDLTEAFADAQPVPRGRGVVHTSMPLFDLATLLRLESGEALLDARMDRPLLLLVGDRGLLVLRSGAAHIAGGTAEQAAPALALRDGARARFHRLAAGGEVEAFDLQGPTHVHLVAEGQPVSTTSSAGAAASLFRDLELFGGALRRQDRSRLEPIPARLWHRIDGPALRRDGRFRVALGGEHPGRVAFEPPASLHGARSLLITLRAPAGTRVAVRALPEAEDAGRALVVDGVLDRDTRGDEPGLVSLELELPQDWARRLGAGELVLGIVGPETLAGSTAVLHEVAFLMPLHFSHVATEETR